MSIEELSPERTRAFYKFKEAEHHAVKHHYDQAIGSAKDALEIDPTYAEVRHWIVSLYIKTDQNRKASMELQEILHANRDDQAAWDKLRQLDPSAAGRLERLQDIAPDPFVVQRTAENAISEDLDDLGGIGGQFVPEAEELTFSGDGPQGMDSLEDLEGTDAVQSTLQGNVGAVPLGAVGSGGGGAGDFDDLDMSAYEETEEPVKEPAPTPSAPLAAASPVDLKSTDWMYEEDLKYRAKIDNNPIYARLLPRVIDFWKDDNEWDTAIKGSVHLDEQRHPEIVQVCREVEAMVGAPKWLLYLCPERRMICTITRGKPNTLSLTTGVMKSLSHLEQVFVIGRHTTMYMVGHLPYLQMVMLTLDRTPRSITDVEIDMLEMLKEQHAGWDTGVHREDRIKLGALCHAWQQRAELTGDRGGLLCCKDLDIACDAIAKSVASDAAAAQTITWRALVEQYKGQDPSQLAAIPPKEDPVRHEGYGVYRIQMLRWWAKTPAAKALLGG